MKVGRKEVKKVRALEGRTEGNKKRKKELKKKRE